MAASNSLWWWTLPPTPQSPPGPDPWKLRTGSGSTDSCWSGGKFERGVDGCYCVGIKQFRARLVALSTGSE